MAIDYENEQLHTLDALPRHLPFTTTKRQLVRWWDQGIAGNSGRRVYLETAKIGGYRCSSVEAVQRFIEKINEEEPV